MVESYLRDDNQDEDHLPHNWDVTSDSIAAHLAAEYGAELVLLKACKLPITKSTASDLAKKGIVDKWFPKVAKQLNTWSVRNLPGGTAAEIALDLLEPMKSVPHPRKLPRAPRSRRAVRVSSKPKRRKK